MRRRINMQLRKTTSESRHLKLKTEAKEVEKKTSALLPMVKGCSRTQSCWGYQEKLKILLHLCKKVQRSEISDWTTH